MQTLLPVMFELVGWMLGERIASALRRAPLPARILLATLLALAALLFGLAASALLLAGWAVVTGLLAGFESAR